MDSIQQTAELTVKRVSLLRRCAGLVLTACILAPTAAFAQAPWTVTVTPSINPLPIGLCGAVHLTILDASGQVPRNSNGSRVTMADFDMAASGASVAGQQIDSTHFVVCACQSGSAGSTGTVTAAYPARAVAAAAVVPAFQRTATFTLAPAKGPSDPPACVSKAAPAISAAPASPATPAPVNRAPLPAPTPATPPTAVALPPVAAPVTVAPPTAVALPPAAPPATIAAPAPAPASATAVALPPVSPPLTLVPAPGPAPVAPSSPLTVVARAQFTFPPAATLTAGQCRFFDYSNPNITTFDTATVAVQYSPAVGELRAEVLGVGSGLVRGRICSDRQPVNLNTPNGYVLNTHLLNNVTMNILVLR